MPVGILKSDVSYRWRLNTFYIVEYINSLSVGTCDNYELYILYM